MSLLDQAQVSFWQKGYKILVPGMNDWQVELSRHWTVIRGSRIDVCKKYFTRPSSTFFGASFKTLDPDIIEFIILLNCILVSFREKVALLLYRGDCKFSKRNKLMSCNKCPSLKNWRFAKLAFQFNRIWAILKFSS